MKNKPPVRPGAKGKMAKEELVFCLVCGQGFENTEERDAHEAICETLGFSWVPRPKDLGQGALDGHG